MKANVVSFAAILLAFIMTCAALLIPDPDPSSYNHTAVAEKIIAKGAAFCNACP